MHINLYCGWQIKAIYQMKIGNTKLQQQSDSAPVLPSWHSFCQIFIWTCQGVNFWSARYTSSLSIWQRDTICSQLDVLPLLNDITYLLKIFLKHLRRWEDIKCNKFCFYRARLKAFPLLFPTQKMLAFWLLVPMSKRNDMGSKPVSISFLKPVMRSDFIMLYGAASAEKKISNGSSMLTNTMHHGNQDLCDWFWSICNSISVIIISNYLV